MVVVVRPKDFSPPPPSNSWFLSTNRNHATGSPFGGMNPYLQSTFNDIAHRLKLIGLEPRH